MTSNTDESAIYTDNTAQTQVQGFESPEVTIAANTHVLDFGKKVEISKTGARYVKSEPNAHNNAAVYDSADGYFAVEGSGISYQPQTTNWSSVDTGYVFGNNSENYWEAESFLPATSVYYEDDFGYTTSGNGTQTKQDGYTTIEYTGNWTTVSVGKMPEKHRNLRTQYMVQTLPMTATELQRRKRSLRRVWCDCEVYLYGNRTGHLHQNNGILRSGDRSDQRSGERGNLYCSGR